MICSIINGPTISEAKEQIARSAKTADLVELRLDLFKDLDFQALQSLKSGFKIPMIFTLRKKDQGGRYPHSEPQRFADIERLAALNPDYLDIDCTVPLELITKISRQTKSILSYHNFEKMPDDLEGLFNKMQETPASLYKIAAMAHSSIDTFRLLNFAGKKKNLIALAMGDVGQVSRILAPVMTYAALDEGQISAPGQLLIEDLSQIYHYRSLNLETLVFGLIGGTISRSFSHLTHNEIMRQLGLNAVYVKTPVAIEQLKEFLPLAQRFGIRGLSVTMPLKEQVMAYLDEIDPLAKQMGAVNTLLFEGGKIKGFNTDGPGALDAVEEVEKVKGKHIVIIGAGGAAKAIAFTAVSRGAKLTVLNRDKEKAQSLASSLGFEGFGLDEMPKVYERGYDILINCTPAQLPIDPAYLIPHALVMDIKNRPKDTDLLLKAKEKGCQIIYGYKMFVHQAVGQFEIWFNHQLDSVKMQCIVQDIAETLQK